MTIPKGPNLMGETSMNHLDGWFMGLLYEHSTES